MTLRRHLMRVGSLMFVMKQHKVPPTTDQIISKSWREIDYSRSPKFPAAVGSIFLVVPFSAEGHICQIRRVAERKGGLDYSQ